MSHFPLPYRLLGLVLLALMAVGTAAQASDYSLQNDHISLEGSGGTFHSLRLAPSGDGNFGPNLVQELMIGVPNLGGLPPRTFTVETGSNLLRLRNLTVYLPETFTRDASGHPHEITGSGRAGVAFHAATGFDRLGARFPTWHTRDTSATATLYRISRLPTHNEWVTPGEKLGEIRLENIVDNAWSDFSFGMQPPGYYFVEITNVSGRLGWWGQMANVHNDTIPAINGRANNSLDLGLRIRGVETYQGDWTVSLDGAKLLSRFTPAAGTPADAIHTRYISAWENTGYDLSDFPFESFYGSTGQFILPHQLKRRPHMPQARSVSWLHAIGKNGADLRFQLTGSPGFTWEMEPTRLHWVVSHANLDLEAHRSLGLPTSFPRFFSSDPELTDLLTDFLLGHGFNLGAGAGVEWKEWQSLTLGWTSNAAKAGVANQLLNYRMTDDGYVYTWGNTIGWPFPFKDVNGDGLNDYDTRHFTTNSNMISAMSRHVAWSRDVSYLQKALPRARLAMEYQLGPLQGAQGLLIGNSADQTGRNGAFGGNYWDLLPFGHKDAFANIYFYNSLARMAELEEMAANLLTSSQAAGGRSPSYYRQLMQTVKLRFTETFWEEAAGRFIGCVDIDGKRRDYGFTFINLEALAYGLGTEAQAARIFDWLENQPTSSGQADTYSRWIFAPRATTFHNPPNNVSQSPRPTWRYAGWGSTPWETQVQDGGTILYIAGYDLMARSRFFGAENVDQRMRAMVNRYGKPDRLMGGSPLFLGEQSQGGPGGTSGAVGVEGEFPESGVAPAAFLRTVLGIEAKPDGLHIKPNLPASLDYAGVENLDYAGRLWRVTVTRDHVMVDPITGDSGILGTYSEDEAFVFRPWQGDVSARSQLRDTFERGAAGTSIAGQLTSDSKARWEAGAMPGENVHLHYGEHNGAGVFAPFSGSGLASVYLDYDVDQTHSYSVHFGRVTLRGFHFGSNLMLAARKGAEDTLRHGYELRPHGGSPSTGPDFWALWFRPGDGSDVPVRNITGNVVTLNNLELRVMGNFQRLYQDGEALDSVWRPTQNKASDGQPDRALQISLNTGPDHESFTHPIFEDLRLMVAPPAYNSQSPLIAYESFTRGVGDLVGRASGSGWSEPFARVASRPSPIWESGLTFGELQVAGSSMLGGDNAAMTRNIATGDLHPSRVDDAGRLGRAGTEVWISFLGHAVNPITTRLWSFSLYRDNSHILYLGKASNETTGSWRLHALFASGTTGHAFTGVPYTEAGFWVMRLRYLADGNHTVHVFRNPDPSGAQPELSSAVATLTRSDLSFNRLRINSGDGLHLDEIRIGSTWEAVSPVPVAFAGFDAWCQEHFTEAELADSSISGDRADPAGDGIPNLLRYALALEPRAVVNRNALPRGSQITTDAEQQFLTLEVRRRADLPDVALAVEVSGDALTWTPDAVLILEEPAPDGRLIQVYQDAEPVGASTRRFMRLNAQRVSGEE